VSLLRRIDPAAGEHVPRRLIWMLGLGAFGLAWSLTTVAAYLPPLLHRFTDSQTTIGGILGAEGAFALALPLVVGPLSDRIRTPLGRRRPWMLVALPPLALGLAAVGLTPSLWTTVVAVGVFFLAYYLYEPPYRSLYPDRLGRDVMGRSQSVQNLLRGSALGLALVLGGVLFGVWHALPFLLAAGVVVLSGGVLLAWVREPEGTGGDERTLRESLEAPFAIVRDRPEVRRFLVANTCWEFTFAGMRTFVVLYVTQGLGEPVQVSSAVLGAVAGGYLVAAAVAGRFGDRFGLAKTILGAAVVYGVGLCTGVVPQQWHWSFLAIVFFVAIAAGTVMTLAWGLLFTLMPESDHASVSGLATVTKGLGLVLGPVLVGLAIDLTSSIFDATHGYQAMWPAVGIPVLLSIPLAVWLVGAEERSSRAAA
jgi:Na+/melibiose symporter-like transporter